MASPKKLQQQQPPPAGQQGGWEPAIVRQPRSSSSSSSRSPARSSSSSPSPSSPAMAYGLKELRVPARKKSRSRSTEIEETAAAEQDVTGEAEEGDETNASSNSSSNPIADAVSRLGLSPRQQQQQQQQQRQPGRAAQVSEAAPVRGGWEAYLDDAVKQSGARKMDGRSSRAGMRFTEGPLRGMTLGQGERMMRQKYAGMSDAERQKWEANANMSDVRSSRELAGPGQYQNQNQGQSQSQGPGSGSGQILPQSQPQPPGQTQRSGLWQGADAMQSAAAATARGAMAVAGEGMGLLSGGASYVGPASRPRPASSSPSYLATNGGAFTSEANVDSFLNDGGSGQGQGQQQRPPRDYGAESDAAYRKARFDRDQGIIDGQRSLPKSARPLSPTLAADRAKAMDLRVEKLLQPSERIPLWGGLGPVEKPMGSAAPAVPSPAPPAATPPAPATPAAPTATPSGVPPAGASDPSGTGSAEDNNNNSNNAAALRRKQGARYRGPMPSLLV